jgi:ZIP family zinc transporter
MARVGHKATVLTAILFGIAASSALVIGAVVGSLWDPPREVTGVLLAFASGALISALAFELFEEAYHLGGATRSGLALLAGAAAFVAADTWLDRRVTGQAGPEQREVAERGAEQAPTGGAQRTMGLALLAAVTLDGVPENLALGVSLVDDASLALLVAIFFSNLPESLVGAVAMRAGGQHMQSVVTTWALCALLLAIAVVAGRALAEPMSDATLSVALGFAGGAVLASLADTLMPEAFERGKPFTAFACAAGFFLSFILAA